MNFKKVLFDQSFENRRVYLWGEVNDKLAVHSHRRFDYYLSQNKDEITVVIDTAGGCAISMSSIMDDIEQAKKAGAAVTTLVMGAAYSAGAFIFAMGSKGHRLVRPLSSVMLHPMSFGLSADYAEHQERVTAFTRRTEEALGRIVAKAVDKKFERFKKDIEKGLWLDAKQAVEYGIADKIVTGV